MDPEVILRVGVRIAAIGLAFGLTVFVHELGHFLSARLAGMVVYEFSLGFGWPRLFSFKRGDTQYSFRLWPFFSYVRIAGMEPDDPHPHGFGRKPRLAQALVLVMGSLMNFLLAVGILVFMGTVIGMPVDQNRLVEVQKGSPAQQAGLLPGDRVVGVNGRTGLSVHQIRKAIRAHPGRRLTLEIERTGKRLSLVVTPRREEELEIRGLRVVKTQIGLIGVVFDRTLRPVGVWESVREGFLFIYDMVHIQIAGLIGVFRKTVPPDFVGPVYMAGLLYARAQEGWYNFLWTFALFTTAVGFLNLLPIPPLDGSRLAILGIEGIRRKPFDQKKVLFLHLIGLALFLGLAVIITYKDILRLLAEAKP